MAKNNQLELIPSIAQAHKNKFAVQISIEISIKFALFHIVSRYSEKFHIFLTNFNENQNDENQRFLMVKN